MTIQKRTGQVQLATLHARDDELFRAQGRIGRVQFWSYSYLLYLAGMVIALPIQIILTPLFFANLGLAIFVSLFLLAAGLFGFFWYVRWTAGRRCHDVGISSWWCLLMLVPIVNVLFSLYLTLAPGYISSNRYGRPPSPADGWVVVIFWITLVLSIAATALLLASMSFLSLLV